MPIRGPTSVTLYFPRRKIINLAFGNRSQKINHPNLETTMAIIKVRISALTYTSMTPQEMLV